MLPIERRNRIQELISERKNIKISELSKLLCVSEMTVHRDLKPLIDQGLIVKTFGGITLASANQSTDKNSNECIYCASAIHQQLNFRIILANDEVEMACCAHCGLLRYHQLGDKVIQAICYDFLKQTTISASFAYYVMDTSLEMDCCQPQLLPFKWEEQAKKFVRGFGGEVYSFQDAMTVLLERMSQNNSSCHK